MNTLLGEALTCYNTYLEAEHAMRYALRKLLADAGFDSRTDGLQLELDMSPYIDTDDTEKPRVFLRTVAHSPSVSIQMEQEHATPEEIRRLAPYLKSITEPWESDALNDEGFDTDIQTARDVALPYEMDDTPTILFVDSFLVGRLPWGLTYEEAVDAANERHARALGVCCDRQRRYGRQSVHNRRAAVFPERPHGRALQKDQQH